MGKSATERTRDSISGIGQHTFLGCAWYWTAIFYACVLPYQNDKWDELKVVAQQWIVKEPTNPEALFYAGIAEERLGDSNQANIFFEKVLALQPQHGATLIELGLMASRAGKLDLVDKTRLALKAIDLDLDVEFSEALKASTKTN